MTGIAWAFVLQTKHFNCHFLVTISAGKWLLLIIYQHIIIGIKWCFKRCDSLGYVILVAISRDEKFIFSYIDYNHHDLPTLGMLIWCDYLLRWESNSSTWHFALYFYNNRSQLPCFYFLLVHPSLSCVQINDIVFRLCVPLV